LKKKEKQNKDKKIFKGSYLNKEGFVCVKDDGSLIKPDYLTHTFHNIVVKNELKSLRLYDLRHSCASLLLKNSVNMKEIQVWLGHSSYNTTANIYAHVDKNSAENPAKVIGNVLSIGTA